MKLESWRNLKIHKLIKLDCEYIFKLGSETDSVHTKHSKRFLIAPELVIFFSKERKRGIFLDF